MTLAEIKELVTGIETRLENETFVIVSTFDRNGRQIRVGLTDRLRQSCKRGRVWKSKAFLTALKNAQYGFDDSRAKSSGGADGIFLLTRNYRPKNQMMKKLFDHFLDKHGSGAEEIAAELGAPLSSLLPVRLVSHHLRLLGVLDCRENSDTLILVDYDDTK